MLQAGNVANFERRMLIGPQDRDLPHVLQFSCWTSWFAGSMVCCSNGDKSNQRQWVAMQVQSPVGTRVTFPARTFLDRRVASKGERSTQLEPVAWCLLTCSLRTQHAPQDCRRVVVRLGSDPNLRC